MSLPTFTPGTEIRASEMNNAFATIFDMMFPVGSIYMSATLSSASAVNSALPGTWVAWGAGRVPVGVDTSQTEFNTAEKTGGEKTHTLTINEMPRHNHSIYGGWGEGPLDYTRFRVDLNSPANLWSGTSYEGNGAAHNNIQPYITCYMYKRVS